MAVPLYLHFSSKPSPQIPLCPPASWPPSPEQPCSRSRRTLAILFEICFIVPWTPVCHLDGKQSETRAALVLSVKWLMHRGGRVGYEIIMTIIIRLIEFCSTLALNGKLKASLWIFSISCTNGCNRCISLNL